LGLMIEAEGPGRSPHRRSSAFIRGFKQALGIRPEAVGDSSLRIADCGLRICVLFSLPRRWEIVSAALFLVIFVPLCEDTLCLRPAAALRTTRQSLK
jgi:hypothetical protein